MAEKARSGTRLSTIVRLCVWSLVVLLVALVGIDHVRRLAETLPGTQLITVDGSHMIPYTHPDVVAGEVRKATVASPTP